MTRSQFGSQERHVVTVLRRSDGALTAQDVRNALKAEGVSFDYQTVASLLEGLVEKGIASRSKEDYPGSPWYRYALETGKSLNSLVEESQ